MELIVFIEFFVPLWANRLTQEFMPTSGVNITESEYIWVDLLDMLLD